MKKKTNSEEIEAAEATEAAKQNASVEELFSELDRVLEKLTDDRISLEESFKWYESGMKLAGLCSEKLDRVERQIIVLNEGNT